MHSAIRYGTALGAFVVLMTAGVLAGRWWSGGPALPPPAEAPAPPTAKPGRLRMIVAGNTGAAGATGRHSAEAAARLASSDGADVVLLLGDLIDPLGLEDREDPRWDERVGPWGFGPPVHLVMGDRDAALDLDPRRPAWLLARGSQAPFVTRSTTWAFEVAGVLVAALGHDRRDPAWLDDRVRRSSATTRILAAHRLTPDEEARACGRFDLVLQAEPATLAWTERCGVAFLVSGAASQVAEPPAGTLFADDQPGFLHLDAGPDGVFVRAIGADGVERFSARRLRSGEVSLPGGEILRAAP